MLHNEGLYCTNSLSIMGIIMNLPCICANKKFNIVQTVLIEESKTKQNKNNQWKNGLSLSRALQD